MNTKDSYSLDGMYLLGGDFFANPHYHHYDYHRNHHNYRNHYSRCGTVKRGKHLQYHP